ncbi:hypothetical protein [Acidovorax sp.]|uniref:hypothetical protein n=1 Tax=Acidovorax sp. TaxID=1872122 RepID=UPI0040379E94
MNFIVTIAIGPAKNFFAVHGVVSKGPPALLCASVPRAKLRELIAAPSTLSLPWKRALVNGSFAVGLPRSAQGRERELAPANSGHSAVSWLGDVQPTTPEDRSSLDTGHCRGRAAW